MRNYQLLVKKLGIFYGSFFIRLDGLIGNVNRE